MLFRQLFDAESSTYTYLLADERTREAVLIDPVREQIERDVELLEELDLKLVYTLETHVHADHVTSSGLLRQRLGSRSVLGAAAGAGCADRLVEDGETLKVGDLEIEARHTPGHTNGDVSYYVATANAVFTGDALLIRGCGRTDFQQGDAGRLYESVHGKIFSLPDETAIYPGHDYKGRTMSTVAEEKKLNPRLGGGKTEAEFRRIMDELKLAHPKKIDIAVPANLNCGLLHHPHDGRWAPIARTDDEVPEVTAEWVRERALENGGDLRLVDVRRPDELVDELGAMPGARNVPLDRFEAEIRDWNDKDQPIVVFCRSGGRSGRAAKMLEAAGFTHVASMHGGMSRWSELGYPVERAEAVACG